MNENESTGKTEVSSDTVFKAIVDQALSFYRLIVTVASTFLGGTLVFIEKIAPAPTQCSLWLLGAGWLFLIATILCVAFVHRLNLQSGKHVMAGRNDLAAPIDVKSRFLSTMTSILLSAGLLAIVAFGMVNLIARTH
jgi:hypothetical protein